MALRLNRINAEENNEENNEEEEPDGKRLRNLRAPLRDHVAPHAATVVGEHRRNPRYIGRAWIAADQVLYKLPADKRSDIRVRENIVENLRVPFASFADLDRGFAGAAFRCLLLTSGQRIVVRRRPGISTCFVLGGALKVFRVIHGKLAFLGDRRCFKSFLTSDLTRIWRLGL